jgi:hypothetical protein
MPISTSTSSLAVVSTTPVLSFLPAGLRTAYVVERVCTSRPIYFSMAFLLGVEALSSATQRSAAREEDAPFGAPILFTALNFGPHL